MIENIHILDEETLTAAIETAMTAHEAANKKPDADVILLTREDVATMLKVNPVTLWRWEKAGFLVPLHLRRSVRYRLSDIQRVLADNTSN